MEIRVENEGQLTKAVYALRSFSGEQKVVFLHGDLGAGKTTFVKEFVKSIAPNEIVSSPTYSLVNEYQVSKNEKIFHIDLYRLNDSYEAQEIGIEDYLDSGHYCFIEWPSVIEHLVDQAIVVRIETMEDNSRKFQFGMLNP